MKSILVRLLLLFCLLSCFAVQLEAMPHRSRRVPADQMQFLEDIVSDMIKDRGQIIRPGK